MTDEADPCAPTSDEIADVYREFDIDLAAPSPVPDLVTDVARLRKFLVILSWGSVCGWCGETFLKEELRAHADTCPKHPSRALEQKIRNLEAFIRSCARGDAHPDEYVREHPEET